MGPPWPNPGPSPCPLWPNPGPDRPGPPWPAVTLNLPRCALEELAGACACPGRNDGRAHVGPGAPAWAPTASHVSAQVNRGARPGRIGAQVRTGAWAHPGRQGPAWVASRSPGPSPWGLAPCAPVGARARPGGGARGRWARWSPGTPSSSSAWAITPAAQGWAGMGLEELAPVSLSTCPGTPSASSAAAQVGEELGQGEELGAGTPGPVAFGPLGSDGRARPCPPRGARTPVQGWAPGRRGRLAPGRRDGRAWAPIADTSRPVALVLAGREDGGGARPGPRGARGRHPARPRPVGPGARTDRPTPCTPSRSSAAGTLHALAELGHGTPAGPGVDRPGAGMGARAAAPIGRHGTPRPSRVGE